MQIDRIKIISSLQSKGFVKNNNDHKYYIYYSTNGKKTIVKTMVSHGSSYKTIGTELIKKMARQCMLTKDEFVNLVECPLSRKKYERILESKKVI